MMILACDTSSDICSVALANDQEILYSKQTSGAQIHIEKLSSFLDEGLDVVKKQPSDLDHLAIAIGPGSFNGLRIGLATMKALALALDLPLIPVKTTDALAYGVRNERKGKGRAVIFSHRDFVHFADYDLSSSAVPNAQEFHYASWDQLNDTDMDFYFGRADRGFKDWLNSSEAREVRDRFLEVQADAVHVARCAASIKLESIPGLDELEPFYNAKYEAKKWVPPKF